jgi:DNA-3-methyladenine glycosylase II
MSNNEVPQAQEGELWVPSPQLRQAVEIVCDRDPDFQRIEAETGPLTVRQWAPGFPSLVRIILGQQLSSRAAQAIFHRLREAVELTPAHLAAASEATLAQVGLSRAKIGTCQRLSQAILWGQLDLDGLNRMSDPDAVGSLLQIKGIGAWTAEVYLLFCLKRVSSFPASDLAVQISYQRLKNLDHRPTRKELLANTDFLDPYRGAAAHLLWHYYRGKKG